MRRTISLSAAKQLLSRTSQLLESGRSERSIRRAVEEGNLIVVRRGWYVEREDWDAIWPEGRHLLRVLSVHDDAVGGAPVFCGVSAAVVLGLPLYRVRDDRVHMAVRRGSSRSSPGVLRHETRLGADDVVEVEGMLCTSPDRTAFDLARTLSPEAATAAADAVLRDVALGDRSYDEGRAEVWREAIMSRALASSARGVRQARRVLDFADGRAESPGESVSRLQLSRLGFRRVRLQVPVVLPGGEECRLDFGLDDVDSFGEFDGASKYLDPGLRGDRSIDQVVLDEKRREDLIRGITGRRLVRWEHAHIRTAQALGMRLAQFGLHPPN
ncbi:type IV toxin-antitoxin system AbiEi family antitoxin domain-containing protein [Streptomyces sp. AC495_CC817]|uniref:type IV toxin-antitoxin system AbiEi family antitoxin domain-containing protein n=1 Tax=Streptomyces sp. AC495_CC817 TaxID=2823900 RepID=UPI001C254A09|nr:type IV toxin-antitoxin system AbiEi family antitoxin domain-containing protein [Streptomyces sp. AC495_CC817]